MKPRQEDVNDPAFNLRGTAQQLVLLEEHLADPTRGCNRCITKHFLHILGLLEEARWMAQGKRYPLLDETDARVRDCLDRWLRDRRSARVRNEVLAWLRYLRQRLIDRYFLSPKRAQQPKPSPKGHRAAGKRQK